jgi:hypothetical protein
MFRLLAAASCRVLVVAALFFACIDASAQVDRGQLEPLYRDLQSSDWGTRQDAFEIIQGNADFLKYPETADRFLALLVFEKQGMMERAAAGLDAEDGLYETLLPATWDLWKDKLTPQAFRVFATAGYSSNSPYAKDLGTRAGRFVGALLLWANDSNEYLRQNTVALMGYALAADQAGVQPLSIMERAALRGAISAASADNSLAVHFAVVNALSLARDAWAIPVLEQMYKREPASGENARARISAAIEAVRSRGQMPSQDFDALQAIDRDLQSSDPEVKSQALNELIKRPDFLSFVDTPDRLLRLLDLETRAIRSGTAREKGSAAQGNTLYETLLDATWQAWKDKLTYPSFRTLAAAVYDPASRYAGELGSQAGRFPIAVMQLADWEDPPTVRTNGVLMLAYALAEDEKSAVRATPDGRRSLTAEIVRAAGNRDPAVRLAVVNALRQVGGAWAIPVLEQMYESESSFDRSGENRQRVEAFRDTVGAAIQSIRSRVK